MSRRTFKARHAMGATVEGIALVAKDGFSARYDLDRVRGVFSRPQHQLAGEGYVGRILVLETVKGGVASAWMLHDMKARGICPLALVFNSVNPIIAQGAALADLPMLSGFDQDITSLVRSGDRIRVSPRDATLEVMERGGCASSDSAISIETHASQSNIRNVEEGLNNA